MCALEQDKMITAKIGAFERRTTSYQSWYRIYFAVCTNWKWINTDQIVAILKINNLHILSFEPSLEESRFLLHANNKGTYQSAYQRCLICVFDGRCMESIITIWV